MEQKFFDKILLCVDCNEEFVFTVGAQEYFAQRGYSEPPKRCKSCYLELKRHRRKDREMPIETQNGTPEEHNHNVAAGNGDLENSEDRFNLK